MAVPNDYPAARLKRKFAALGPYLREGKCRGDFYFFDCLSVCTNAKPAPEKREFLGWWMDVMVENDGLYYRRHIGIFDKGGNWQLMNIDRQECLEEIEASWQTFLNSFMQLLAELELTLKVHETIPDAVTPTS